MKQYINRFLLIAGAAITLTGCGDNTWNNELNGFEGSFSGSTGDKAQTVEYTLTPTDYKTLSGLAANVALAGDNKAALTAVGTQCYFTDEIPAQDYIPAFLSVENFPYFALNDGSSVKVTYNVGAPTPQQVTGVLSATKYVVSDEDYQAVWESENDYTAAFAPSHPAAKSLPTVLKSALPDAKAGDYVIVNYNNASVDPVFTSTPDPDVPGFTLSNVIATAAAGDNVTINGYVSALTSNGFVITDASGSLFVYRGNTFEGNSYEGLAIGSQAVVEGEVSGYNYGLQVNAGAAIEIKGTQDVTYPTAKAYTGAEMDALAAQASANPNDGKTLVLTKTPFVSITGTVAINGNNINILVAGASTAQASAYYVTSDIKGQLTNGATVTIEGYFIAIAGRKYFSIATTSVKAATSTTTNSLSTRVANVASENENAVYTFDGSKWAPAASTVILSHADYQAMGQNYDNLSGQSPATLLPLFLKQKFPYAQPDDVKYVAYYYYNGSETVTECATYSYDGAAWTVSNNSVTETSQFTKVKGKWMYNPNVTITLPAGRNQPLSTLYFQACVDWVRANVADGAAYISNYGNNDYYTGASAYQGNVDLRPSAAKTQYPGYDSMSDEALVALLKQRFESEVMPAVLGELHPDAAPVAGLQVLYTINFYYYNGTTHPATVVYEVVGKGKFELVSAEWSE